MSYLVTSEEDDSCTDISVESDHPYCLHEPCPGWCDKVHEEHLHVCDRRHISSGCMSEVVLSSEDPIVRDGQPGEDPHYFPTELVIYLDQHVREVAPRVILDQLPEGRTKLHFLPAEAHEVGEALIRLAAMVVEDGDTTGWRRHEAHP